MLAARKVPAACLVAVLARGTLGLVIGTGIKKAPYLTSSFIT